jgi:hypothetical protein
MRIVDKVPCAHVKQKVIDPLFLVRDTPRVFEPRAQGTMATIQHFYPHRPDAGIERSKDD